MFCDLWGQTCVAHAGGLGEICSGKIWGPIRSMFGQCAGRAGVGYFQAG